MSNQDYYTVSPWEKFLTKKWGKSIPEKTCQALRDLGWIDPNDIQNIKGELEQARATILVNFGTKGKTRPGLASNKDSLTEMILDVFKWYEKRIETKDNTVYGEYDPRNK